MTAAVPARRWLVAGLVCAAAVAASLLAAHDPVAGRAGAVAAVVLTLWLAELVPPFVPTLALVALVPLVLGARDPTFRIGPVLRWLADPVLALFLGGFALGVAAERHGLDAVLTRQLVRASRGRPWRLVAFTLAGTAFLSMWISNIAAAALVLGAVRPSVRAADAATGRALLLATAVGADLGGIATPVGTGPNAIAIAELATRRPVTFAGWMGFGVPVTALALIAGLALIRIGRTLPATPLPVPGAVPPPRGRARGVRVVFALTVLAWLTEPWHGVPAAVVSLAAVAALFGGGLLARDDLARIDWSTLLLIAGGIGLGRLLEHSGVVTATMGGLGAGGMHETLRLALLALASATMSALMSNTATAAMLIPFGMSLDPRPSTAIVIALAASFGMPFVISTPPNAMAVGEGLPSRELLRVGLPMMLLGCALLALAGPVLLRLFGIG